MSFLTAAWTATPQPSSCVSAFAPCERADRYLTDGTELYRWLGPVRRGRRQLVGLENCRSLEVVLVGTRELRRLRALPLAPVG